jgi:hypothetical protein
MSAPTGLDGEPLDSQTISNVKQSDETVDPKEESVVKNDD